MKTLPALLVIILLAAGCVAPAAGPAALPPQTLPGADLTSGQATLPEHITALLEKKAAAIASSKRLRLDKDFSVLDASLGDLNGDGQSDLAVVVERMEDGSPGRRFIVVLLNDGNGGFTAAHTNSTLILDHTSGGVFGDPYEGIAIANGRLLIKHYGGSNFRWSFQTEFQYLNGRFRLVRLTRQDMYTGTGNGEETVCDFVANTVQRSSYSAVDDNESTLLYSGKLKEKAIYLFDTADFDTILKHCEIPFLPSLGYYRFDRFSAPLDLRVTASEALDRVKKQYFPDYKKVLIPWAPSNREAYSKLLFYTVPEYYYQGAGGTLTYFELDIDDANETIGSVVHTILHGAGVSGTFYKVDDASGKVKTLP